MTSKTNSHPSAELLGSDQITPSGIDGTTGSYLTAPMSTARAAAVARGIAFDRAGLEELQRKMRCARQLEFGTIEGLDPNDLAQVGWAAVFPAVTPDTDAARRQAAIRAALAPLLDHRRAQATRYQERLYQEYSGERGYRRGESKQQYLARLGAGPGPVNPDKVPYYLLLVASPEEIPYRIQYQIDVQYAVGRIAFDAIEDYERYARSVVETETGAIVRQPRAVFFAAAHAGDRATALSRAHLAEPLARHVSDRFAGRGWAVDRCFSDQATHARLSDILRDAPAVLFTASHGIGFASGHEHQRPYQGALLCQDWGGPGSGPPGRDQYFAGEDLDPRADLRGMIAMHFACFGMGTPMHDEFPRWTSGTAQVLAPQAFVARLPQRMLAHPGGGALAAIGHVDRAWSSSFLWIDVHGERQSQRHLEVFESALASIMQGKRAGYAMEHFNLRYAELAADLSARIEEIQIHGEAPTERELAQLWIFCNDARNHGIVGDPAVHLTSLATPDRTVQDLAFVPGAVARDGVPAPTGESA
jgi:hypothetical protein